MSYAGLKGMSSKTDPALGGNVQNGDPFSYSPKSWEYMIKRFSVRSVLDFGCGRGHAADYMNKNFGSVVYAADGLKENVETSLYPVILHDVRSGPLRISVDLVYCVEVAEHIAEEFLENLLVTLTNGHILVMTHALPGQDGHHHVNCQPPEYWREKLAGFKFNRYEEDSKRLRAIASSEGAEHLARTGTVFGR